MNTPQTPADAVREALSIEESIRIFDASSARTYPNKQTAAWEVLRAHIADQTAQLAQCFKIAGADCDGNEDWRIAPRAVQAVTDLRRDYDEACNEAETLRHAALAGAAPDDAAELEAWRELGRCVFLGLPTFPKKWPQDVSAIGYSLSMRHKAHAPAKAREVTEEMVLAAQDAYCDAKGSEGELVYDDYGRAMRAAIDAALATFAEGSE